MAALYEATCTKSGSAVVLAARDVRPGHRRCDQYPSSCRGASAPRCCTRRRRGMTARLHLALCRRAPCLHARAIATSRALGAWCKLVDGPFSLLDGLWQFQPIGGAERRQRGDEQACRIEFELRLCVRQQQPPGGGVEPGVRHSGRHLGRPLRAARGAGAWPALSCGACSREWSYAAAPRDVPGARCCGARQHAGRRAARQRLLDGAVTRDSRRVAGRHLGARVRRWTLPLRDGDRVEVYRARLLVDLEGGAAPALPARRQWRARPRGAPTLAAVGSSHGLRARSHLGAARCWSSRILAARPFVVHARSMRIADVQASRRRCFARALQLSGAGWPRSSVALALAALVPARSPSSCGVPSSSGSTLRPWRRRSRGGRAALAPSVQSARPSAARHGCWAFAGCRVRACRAAAAGR